MAGLIEKNAKTPITVRVAGEIIDGETSFENHPALAMVFESSQADVDNYGSVIDNYGTVQQEKTFLVAPFDVKPEIPCEIIYDEENYVVKSIKTIRNMKGVLLGYKITTVNGS
jgi:hypothetical protein